MTLDLAFRRAVVLLCETCSITLKNLTLKNARRGSGAALDFFVGDERQGATAVLLENVYRLRLACTPGSDTAEVLENTPRSKVLPNPNGKQQFAVKPTPFQVRWGTTGQVHGESLQFSLAWPLHVSALPATAAGAACLLQLCIEYMGSSGVTAHRRRKGLHQHCSAAPCAAAATNGVVWFAAVCC